MIVTLKVIFDLYDKQGDPNKQARIIKKNVKYLKQFETTEILAEQYLNSKGELSKKYSMIKEGDNYFKVEHKFEELEKLTSHIRVKGFRE